MTTKGHPFQPKCSISITNSAGVTMVFHDEEAIRQGAEDMREACAELADDLWEMGDRFRALAIRAINP